MGISEYKIKLADEAERHISKTLTAVAASEAPTFEGAAGEITMAYKLGLIDYPRRDELICQLRVIVSYRRKQLRKQHLERLGITAESLNGPIVTGAAK
jgi:hypothetical protein